MEIIFKVCFIGSQTLPDMLHDISAKQRIVLTRSVLLIGGAGYIGPVIARALLDDDYDVTILDSLIYNNRFAIERLFSFKNFKFVNGSMGNPIALTESLINIDCVILLAGLVGDPITKKYPNASADINERQLQFCIRKLSDMNLDRVVFVSTCSNYGLLPDNALADEKHPTFPLSLYAQAKVSAEKLLISLSDKSGFCPTILRFATAFGLAPRMRYDLTVNEFTREMFLGNELVVFDPDTWRPYCHVRDFAEIVRLVINSPRNKVCGEIYNAGSNENNFTKRQLVKLISHHVDNPKVVFKDHGTDPRNYKVDFSKIQERLNFKPSHSIESGILEIIDILKREGVSSLPENENYYGNYSLDLL